MLYISLVKLKQLNIKIMTDLLKQEVYSRVKKELESIEPEMLNQLLWDTGHCHTMGFGDENTNVKIYDMVKNDFEEFSDVYYAWHSSSVDNLMNNVNFEFETYMEEYYPEVNEETRYSIAVDWVDEEGFVYGGFSCYVAELIGDMLEEIEEEAVEKTTDEYFTKLKTIEGLEVEYIDSGLELYTTDEDDSYNYDIEAWVEYTAEDGWSYSTLNNEFDTFDELFDYIKTNIKLKEEVEEYIN